MVLQELRYQPEHDQKRKTGTSEREKERERELNLLGKLQSKPAKMDPIIAIDKGKYRLHQQWTVQLVVWHWPIF